MNNIIAGDLMELWGIDFTTMQNSSDRTVVTEQNVYLDILITPNGWEFQLMPIGEYEDEEEEDD